MSQILDGIPIEEITEDHLKSLQLLRVTEGPRLEFKQELKISSSSDKREFCKDVSAIANSQGGYILYGVSEASGVIADIPGIEYNEPVQQRFFQIVTSGISPRIQAFSEKAVPLRNGKHVLLLKVSPDGYLHQVKYDDNRYYKRTGTITIAMESSDVESFFTSRGPASRNEEIEEFIAQYYASLKGKKYFKGVAGQGICAAVIVPEVTSYKIDFGNLPRDMDLLFSPLYCSGWDSEVTGKARFTFGKPRDEKLPYAVTEVTEFGELKAFNSFLLDNSYSRATLREGARGFVPPISYETELINGIHKYLTSFAQLGVSPPFFVNCAMLGVSGYYMYVDPMRFSNYGRILQQDDVLPDSVKFVSESEFSSRELVARSLKPIFDFIWREFGFLRSFNYSEDGNWNPEGDAPGAITLKSSTACASPATASHSPRRRL